MTSASMVQRYRGHRQHPALGRSSRPTQSSPATGSLEQLPERDDEQVAERVPAERPVAARTGAAARRARSGPTRSSPHSAASAIRRSPGGSTPSSSRSRPDEPPSSATVTTAVTWSVTWRRAVSVAARPWPPPERGDDRRRLTRAPGRGARRGGHPVGGAAARRPPRPSPPSGACPRCSRPRWSRSASPRAGSPGDRLHQVDDPVEELGGTLLAHHPVAPPARRRR